MTEGLGPATRTRTPDAAFRQQLIETIPHLRAFARGLCGRPDVADDLVQETMVKAWAARDRFMTGSSMRAWTYVILRNLFRSDLRRNRMRGDYDEALAERILVTEPGQEAPLHLADMHRALMKLPTERREALLLVGAGGFSYEEAASICGCATGTMKSRVARARAAINAMLEAAPEAAGAVPAGAGPATAGPAARTLAGGMAAGDILAQLDHVVRPPATRS